MSRLRTYGVALVAGLGWLVLTAAPASAGVLGVSWPNPPGAWPTVAVSDRTGTAWPVRAATAAWGSGLRYAACSSAPHCIRVSRVNSGPNGTVGTARYAYDERGTLLSCRVVVNDYYASRLSRAERYQAVAHELGHCLGLGHNSRAGVMYPEVVGYAAISQHDRRELRSIYGVRGTATGRSGRVG